MTILDDARSGMNPDIRPQDDLFGHVNGRWLDVEGARRDTRRTTGEHDAAVVRTIR